MLRCTGTSFMRRSAVLLAPKKVSLHELKGVALQHAAARAAGKPTPSTLIIDVREGAELKQTGAFPQALHIPMSELEEQLGSQNDEFFKKWHAIDAAPTPERNSLVFVCAAGGRSARAVQKAEGMGYTRVSHFNGGWTAFSLNPLTDDDIERYVRRSMESE